jgi:hypothetical protein
MSRTIFAIAFAGLIFTAASGASHAAPILPLPAAAACALSWWGLGSSLLA